MDNNQSLVPQYVLDQLADQVCMKLDYFNRHYTPAKMWDGVIEACGQIEQNPEAVNSIIVEAKQKLDGVAINGSNIRYYHMFLTRVYVFLYYRHPDDEIYRAIVFHQLEENMGVYRDKSVLSHKIHEPISSILKHRALLENARKAQKFGKPKFELYDMKENEVDGYMDMFMEEALFRFMNKLVKPYWNSHFGFRFNFVEIWYNAKDVVKKLWNSNYPQFYIGYVMERYDNAIGVGHVDTEYAQAVMCCVYYMMRTVTKSGHFTEAVKVVASYDKPDSIGFDLLATTIRCVNPSYDKMFAEFIDYDYVGEPTPTDTFTKSDVERIVGQYTARLDGAQQKQEEIQQKLEEALAEIEKLKAEQQTREDDIEIEDEKEQEDILYNKVVYEFLLRLLEKVGLDIDNTGNKTKYGELIHMLTGKSSNESRQYCSSRRYKNDHTSDDIKRLNMKLSDMGVNDFQL